MGNFVSRSADDLREKKSLRHGIARLDDELKKSNTTINRQLVEMEEMRGQLADMEEMRGQVEFYQTANTLLKRSVARSEDSASNYKKMMVTKSEQTADTIMGSNLHLEYLDEVVEKKYICDILRVVYDTSNN